MESIKIQDMEIQIQDVHIQDVDIEIPDFVGRNTDLDAQIMDGDV